MTTRGGLVWLWIAAGSAAWAQEPGDGGSLPAAVDVSADAGAAPAVVDAGAPSVPLAAKPAVDPSSAEEELFALDDELKVVSASQQEEPLSEAPAPVTIITQEMMRSIGARNLHDVLVTYVPGMTNAQDHNELNVAMRGVYGSSQQKILILLNGHRLNSRAYAMANPDFAMGLDKLKRIEVLRGPGSTVYGNIALTAVINLVTYDGADVNGVWARAGFGNWGQAIASGVAGGKVGERGDVLVWGQYYHALGESVGVPAEAGPTGSSFLKDYSANPQPGRALVGGYRDPPSHDVGARLKLGDFAFLLNSRFGKMTDPMTSGGAATGELYDYHALRKWQGLGPGVGHQWWHAEGRWARDVLPWLNLDLTANFDKAQMLGFLTSNPSGGGSYLGWDEHAVGVIAQGRGSYDFGAAGSGNLTLGAQVEYMRLEDSLLLAQTGGDWRASGDTSGRKVLEPGQEVIYSGFVQLKHKLFKKVTFNLGLRYDNKDRHDGPNVAALSPRLAVAWVPSQHFDLKLSYARSFVDAPYWYRYNSLRSYQGSRNLTPEFLNSVQLTGTLAFLDGRLKNSLNVAYNDLTDFVYRDNAGCSMADPVCYRNAGALRTLVFEDELAFTGPWWRLRANGTFQYLLEGKDYGTSGWQIWNVPSLVGNFVADVNPLAFLDFSGVWLNGTVRYVGEQLTNVDLTFRDASGAVVREFKEPNAKVGGCWLVNAGLHVSDVGVKVLKGVTLDVTVHNVFNQRCFQGGSVQHPYPQAGTWVLGTLGYRFSP